MYISKIGTIMVPTALHILTLRNYKYVTLKDKGDFADVIKLRVSKQENYSRFSSRLNIIPRILLRET